MGLACQYGTTVSFSIKQVRRTPGERRIGGRQAVRTIHVAGTCDTKGEEIAYLRDLIVAAGQPVTIVDLGTRAPTIRPDISRRSRRRLSSRRHQTQCWAAPTVALAVAAMGLAFADWCRANAGQISGHHRGRRRRRHLHRLPGHARAALRRAEADGLDPRLGRHRALCRHLRHHHGAIGHRHRRAEPPKPRDPVQRRPCHRRGGQRARHRGDGRPARASA